MCDSRRGASGALFSSCPTCLKAGMAGLASEMRFLVALFSFFHKFLLKLRDSPLIELPLGNYCFHFGFAVDDPKVAARLNFDLHIGEVYCFHAPNFAHRLEC